jgi:hypothetical protein
MSKNGKRALVRRASHYASKDRPPQPGDEHGQWTEAQLVRMNADFVAAMERAIERGFERRPDGERV